MNILILGAGATGGYFGARLIQAIQSLPPNQQAHIQFLVRPARKTLLDTHGLRIESPHGNFQLPIQTVSHTELKNHYDLVLLSCKAYDLETSILSIYPAIGPHTLILPLLNGLAHIERLQKEWGTDRVLGGTCHLAGTLSNEGIIRQLDPLHRITYGATQKGSKDSPAGETLNRWHQLWAGSPVNATLSEDIEQDMWEKFVMLCTLAASCCLMRGNVGDIVATDRGKDWTLRTLMECENIAKTAGHPPREKAAQASRRLLGEKGSTFAASMLRDLEAGGTTEAQHIVGDMVKRCQQQGIEAPMLELAWCHLQVYEAKRRAK